MSASPSPPCPPHCPNPECDSHGSPGTWRFKKKGFFPRPRRGDQIQRYLCQHCGRSFSDQTFSLTYWLRRPELLHTLFFRTRACSALRQIAQELGLAHATVQRQVERLGRHCLLFHERLRPRVPREPLVCTTDTVRRTAHSIPRAQLSPSRSGFLDRQARALIKRHALESRYELPEWILRDLFAVIDTAEQLETQLTQVRYRLRQCSQVIGEALEATS